MKERKISDFDQQFDESSAKLKGAKMAVMFEAEQFTDFIRTVDPGLKPNEALMLTAFILHQLPELFQENPLLLDRFKEMATTIRNRR